jgi:hypothetical protein
MQHRFTSTALLLTGALLVWIADFAFVYVFSAVACARGLGVSLIPAVTTLASLIAGIATVWIWRRGYCAHRANGPSQFIAFVTLATSTIALVALGMLILPPLLVRACV